MSLKNLNAKIKIPKLFRDKLRNKKINQIYKEFENTLCTNKAFIVAVSGGPDSLALAFLAKIYSIKFKLNSKFFIIDHKLRLDSTTEAKTVKKILMKYGINSEILTWKGKKPVNNIQSIARNMRYELLLDQCKKFKINSILLGHHQDDLFENFFIRMFRGSGLKGLVSLDLKSKISNRYLIRPLLNQKKEDLEFLSNNVFNFYVQDPSNKNEKYLRVKIRKLLEILQKNGLDRIKFKNTIKNLKYSNQVVKFYVDENLKNNVSFLKNKLVLNDHFFKQPYEVVFRSLSETIKIIGNKFYSVRGKKIDRLIDDIENLRLKRATLGGCIIEKANQTVIISKEH